MMLFLALVFILLYVLYSWYMFKEESKKTNIPGPACLPIIGNGNLFLGGSTKFLGVLLSLRNKYGDPSRVFLLADAYIVLSNPKYFETIMSTTEHITKADSYKFLHKWLGQGLLTSTGAKWKTQRRLLTPAFHFNILQTFLPIFSKNQKVLIKKLMKLADGRTVNLFPIMALAALDNISESAMGVSINALEDSESDYVKAIDHISSITMERMFNPFMGIDFIFNLLPHKKKYDHALEVLHKFTQNVIMERNEQLQQNNVTLSSYDSELGIKKKSAFLDLLLLSEVNGERLNMDSVREEVDTFMFEGHDTTTSALCFTLFCISNNEGIDEKILEEQRSIFGENTDPEPTYNDLQQMKYLEQVIKESLRLYPTVPIFGRKSAADIEINGHKIPKGWNIALDVFNMQRNPKYFPDPLKFRPERFDAANNTSHVYSWVAFSAGPRNCIGQKYALMELKYVISSVIRHFKVLPAGIEPALASDLILRSKNGICVRILPRD